MRLLDRAPPVVFRQKWIDLDDGLTLSLVLDDMRMARDAIDSVRHINNQGGVNNGPIERARDEAATLLANAHDELTELSAAFDAPAEGGTGR